MEFFWELAKWALPIDVLDPLCVFGYFLIHMVLLDNGGCDLDMIDIGLCQSNVWIHYKFKFLNFLIKIWELSFSEIF